MSREEIARRFVQAEQNLHKAREPINQFEHMLKQWGNQPSFRWGGVDLTMDVKAITAFRYQLEMHVAKAQDQYNDAKAALNAI